MRRHRRRRRPDVDRRRDGRRALRGRATTTTRVLMEAATWNGPNIQRTSTRLGAAHGGLGRFEKQLAPEQALEAQARRRAADGRAVRRAARRRARSTSAAPGPPPAVDPPARRARRAAARRARSPRAERAPRSSTALGFGVDATRADGLDVTVPHFRRDDVTREVDLDRGGRAPRRPRQAARPRCRRAAAPSAALAPRAARCAAAPRTRSPARGLHEVVGWSFDGPRARRPAAAPGRRSAPRRRRAREPDVRGPVGACARRCSARCSTSRGATARAASSDVRLFEIGAVYLPPTRARRHRRASPTGNRGDAGGPTRRCPTSATHVGALLAGPLRPPSWREPEPPRADFFAAKGVLAALLDALRVAVARRGRRASRSCTPAARARVLRRRARRRAGSASCTRPSRAAWDLDGGGAASSSTSALRRRGRARRAALRGPHVVPRRAAGPRGRRRRRRARPPTCSRSCATRAARCCAGAEIFDVYRGAQVGEGRVVARPAARVPRARPHADRRGGRAAAREDRRRRCASRLGGELRG